MNASGSLEQRVGEPWEPWGALGSSGEPWLCSSRRKEQLLAAQKGLVRHSQRLLGTHWDPPNMLQDNTSSG